MKNQFLLSFIILLFATSNFAQDKTIDSLKQALKTAKNDTTRCNILCELVMNSSEDEWPKFNDEYEKICEKALQNYQKSDLEYKVIKEHYAGALSNSALNFGNKGDIQNQLKYNLRGLKVNEEINNKQGVGQAFNSIGVMYLDQGNTSKALEYLEKSLKINEEIHDKQGLATSLNYIASIYTRRSDLKKALECYYKSLKIRGEIGDKHGEAITLNNLAVIYGNQGDKKKELELTKESLKLRQEIHDKYGITASLLNLGAFYYNQDSIIKASTYYHQALIISHEIQNKPLIARALGYIGKIYLKQDSSEKALELWNQALKIEEELQNNNGIARILKYIGKVYIEQKKYPIALNYLLKSMAISKKLGFPAEIGDAAEELNIIYKVTGNYKAALENYELYIIMRDSVNNQENKKASIKSQFKYEYEKKATADSVKVAEEKKVVAVQLKQEKTQRFALYGGLVLVVLFAGFMFNRFRVTQKQKNIIELKEKETQQQNEIITIQKHLVEEKHKEITDSINYAERIQRSFLATEKQLNENLNNYFVLFKPKDVVSGDFYWSAKLTNSNFALATADSTGHGVPGAIMSLLNVTSLEKAIEHYNNPADILNHTRQTIIERLKKDGSEEGGKDGMDCSLLVFDFENKQLHIAAANNPVWIIRPNPSNEGARQMAGGDVELIEIKPDKMPVGKSDKQHQPFTLHTIELQKGDTIYTLTDGFPDQFGGPKGKKFMSKNLKELLLANVHLPIAQQKELLDSTFKNWVGDLEQVDDVCVVGIKV